MKLLLPLLLLLLPQVFSGNSKEQGRRGNTLYEQEQYDEAAQAYTSGLTSYGENAPDEAYYGLQHNLGAALHRKQDFQAAQSAFTKALETARSDADYARAAYNAGNNAFFNQQAEAALDHYKNALLANPNDVDAKFNYEFVKRQLEQQQQQQGQDQNQDQEQNNEQNQDQQQEQNQEQNNEQEENQQQDQQNQQQQDQQNQQQQQQDQQQPQPDQQLSREQAERILQALENEEEQLLREVQKMKGRPRRVEKDW